MAATDSERASSTHAGTSSRVVSPEAAPGAAASAREREGGREFAVSPAPAYCPRDLTSPPANEMESLMLTSGQAAYVLLTITRTAALAVS